MGNKVKNEAAPVYKIDRADDDIVTRAIQIVGRRLTQPDAYITQPGDVKRLAILELATEPAEVFAVVWLDNRHGVLSFDRMFNGTIDGCSVPAREVIRRAIDRNAAACVLVHNHPSGNPQPSEADRRITARLREALALIDVRVLDHIVVGGVDTVSFAETGRL